MPLKHKKIVLAVTGSIAAYKTPELVRQLIKKGAEVKVITTPSAQDFVSVLSLATVSKQPVLSDVSNGAAWNNHVEMGRWADLMLIAPCSANTLAKIANGLCDNLMGAVYLSATCPVLVAPAMDEDMWHHTATKNNVEKIKSYGNQVIPVGHGELASGLIGKGRMAELEDLVDFVENFLNKTSEQKLQGQQALVTAGPTYERIDPVRFIGNFSTGKMGIALAEALASQGAEVKLVLGPTYLKATHPNIQTINVESADEMYEASMKHFPDCQIGILSAAVADYRPQEKAHEKIKKKEDTLHIQLTKNKDILASLGSQKIKGQTLVGFALETNNEEENALKKLKAKNADMIVLNSLQDKGAGFGHDTNKVILLKADGSKQDLPLMTKQAVAEEIVNAVILMNHEEKDI